jgi:hypothetical protein
MCECEKKAKPLTDLKHAVLRLVESCGGAELHWVGSPVGESIQGWYKSKTQARKAHAALPLLDDGSKIQLVLPAV